MAGALGIEPRQAVLETAVLPLYDAPIMGRRILLCFLVSSMLLAPFTKLLHFQTIRILLFILLGMIVGPMAIGTLHHNQIIL
jgi:hypothetical protein